MTKLDLSQKKIVSGVLLIDKPQGLSSQQVVSKVKYLLQSPMHNSKKAGHTGTLDPMATGLLPICLGEATKFSHYQLNAAKSYQAILKLGTKTDTGDAEGKAILSAPVAAISQLQLDIVNSQFLGKQYQVPPMYSALKKDGKKLYELARAGIDIEREAREIDITQLSLSLQEPDEISLTVTCSKGTYVRVLGEDIAAALGTVGHLTALRRLATGDFSLANALTLPQFEALSHTERLASLLPTDACIRQVPKLYLVQSQAERISQGQRLNVTTLAQAQGINLAITHDIRLYDEQQNFIGLGHLESNGRLQPLKVIQNH